MGVLGSVGFDFLSSGFDGFAEMNMRIHAAEGNVAGIGQLDTVRSLGSRVNFERFARAAENLAVYELACVQVDVAAMEANGFSLSGHGLQKRNGFCREQALRWDEGEIEPALRSYTLDYECSWFRLYGRSEIGRDLSCLF